MAHVVLLALHRLGVDGRELVIVGVGAEHFLGKTLIALSRLLLGGLDKHLPETLRGVVIKTLVGGGVSEEVRHGLAKFLDSNGEAVSLVGLNHLQEGVAGSGTSKSVNAR